MREKIKMNRNKMRKRGRYERKDSGMRKQAEWTRMAWRKMTQTD